MLCTCACGRSWFLFVRLAVRHVGGRKEIHDGLAEHLRSGVDFLISDRPSQREVEGIQESSTILAGPVREPDGSWGLLEVVVAV